ncbi:transposable element Tcb2 transposase [Trichonephila clavipes]|nr:transposable element Tcb2 transposase [Trichonephila clavipes]
MPERPCNNPLGIIQRGNPSPAQSRVCGRSELAQVAPRVTTTNEDLYLAVTAKRNRRSTASYLSRQLSSTISTTVLRQTVYRRIGHIGLYARRPVRCVPLTATDCRLRLTWSRERAMWTSQQWSYVIISDESRFSFKSILVGL